MLNNVTGHVKIESTTVPDFWLWEFIKNCVTYAALIVPGYLFVRYYRKKREWLEQKGTKCTSAYKSFVKLFVFGTADESPSNALDGLCEAGEQQRRNSLSSRIRATRFGTFFLLAFCFVGLQTSYLIWGYYQEKMMTTDYYFRADMRPVPPPERFRDSQFVVLLNRLVAFFISFIYIYCTTIGGCRTQKKDCVRTPSLYKYSYASFSNILSAWCQYEALKYISFPTQVLGKASKIIPTMLAGRLIQRKSYPYYQYATGFMISAGVSMFLLSGSMNDWEKTGKKLADSTSLSGLVLICGYLAFDSFTTNWQDAIFKKYAVSSMQMMCFVNMFSTIFTFVPLLQRGKLIGALNFMTRHPDFCNDALATSLCSAVGQLFIYFTINQFDAVTFSVIMTIRQAIAIGLSCVFYGHAINELGVAGLVLVFGSVWANVVFRRICAKSKPNLRT